MPSQRLSFTMNTLKFERRHDAYETPAARADRLAIWILLAVGLFLMLVSTGRADQGSATRTESVQRHALARADPLGRERLGRHRRFAGEGVSAAVTVTVSAPTQKQAEELLRSTRIEQSHDEDGWSLETRWPGMHGRGDSGRGSPCSRCRVEASYDAHDPPGRHGGAEDRQRRRACAGPRRRTRAWKASTEPSTPAASGSRSRRRRSTARSTRRRCRSTPEDSVELQSVNGSVTLTLPKDAQFDLSAETMNGTIASTFPLPKQALVPGRVSGGRTPRPRRATRASPARSS